MRSGNHESLAAKASRGRQVVQLHGEFHAARGAEPPGQIGVVTPKRNGSIEAPDALKRRTAHGEVPADDGEFRAVIFRHGERHPPHVHDAVLPIGQIVKPVRTAQGRQTRVGAELPLDHGKPIGMDPRIGVDVRDDVTLRFEETGIPRVPRPLPHFMHDADHGIRTRHVRGTVRARVADDDDLDETRRRMRE